ncbi:YaiI/YqxD family protein [Anaerovorax sp. IOR16]|uniref:YaiI/YqxD family protein n=1 Tax=Anaerovorax sp. IOR16 TaxID=2773458 RepID=UPI0019CFAA70|nr:YaiI/YqxD family protein [Anaerovorax sp. IOR16]
MRILIDADGCPVVDIAVHLAKKYQIECIILCDTSHYFDRDGVQTITVSKGADSVDFVLVNLVQKGDVVITQDYGLAAMCLARNAMPISQNGMIYSKDNIDALLMQRHTSKKIRMAGGRYKGMPKRTKEQDQAFEEVLRGVLIK